jgi:hypothetical protein
MVINRVFLLLLLLNSGIGFAQEARFSAKVDTGTFQIGSWIDVHVQGTISEVVDSIAPVAKDSLGSCEIIKVEREGIEPKWLLRLTTIDSGQVFLPPIEFDYRVRSDTNTHKAFTNSLLINVAGISVNPEAEIKDIKPPMSAPWLFEDFLPYLIALVIVAAIAGGYYYYWRKRKQKKDFLATVKAEIPSHREALAALRVLEEKRLWQQGRVKEYYSEVTEIVRRFFERRWSVVALELTSEEILIQMKRVPEALKVWKEMETFFLTADLVKFAKYQPSPDEHIDEMRIAYEIVRSMVPKVPAGIETKPQEVTANVGG